MHTLTKYTAFIIVNAISWISPNAVGDSAKQFTPEIDISVGGMLQPVFYYNDSELISERDTHDMRLRRGRLNFKGSMDEWIRFGIQTEMGEEPASSTSDARIIDAFIHLKPNTQTQLFIGQFMPPATRQGVTRAGALMTIDRPGVIYKSLTWGTRAPARFSTLNMNTTDAGVRGTVDVRDIGLMLMGTDEHDHGFHYKYYVGFLEGARSAQSERILLRGQLNWGDAEPDLFQNATYFGTKDTLSIGISVDQQTKVAVEQDTEDDVDYLMTSVDLFAEKPIGNMSISAEAAYIKLDLDDAGILVDPISNDPLNNNPATNAQGSGFYFQSGLTIGRWQPWIGYEQWQSDGENNIGSYSGFRIGATYQLWQHKANVKFGYEQIDADQPFSNSLGETTELGTFAAGIFITF